MDLFLLIDKLKALSAAVKAGDLVTVLELVGDLAKLTAVVLGSLSVAGVDPEADFSGVDNAVAELELVAAEPGIATAAADSDSKAIDPQTIITILSLVKTLIDLFKKRKA